MKAKIPKCSSLGIQASTSKKIDPQLSLHGQKIPHANQAVKFLGMRVEVPHDQSKSKEVLVTELERMLKNIDICPLTRKQKLLLYKAGVCPRLSWLLTIEEMPISWVEKNLNALATGYIKKWAGLAHPANTAVLYLPHKWVASTFPYSPPSTRDFRSRDKASCRHHETLVSDTWQRKAFRRISFSLDQSSEQAKWSEM